jgi:hypothetical protein
MPLKDRSGPFPLLNPGLLSIRAVTKCLTKSSPFRIQLALPKSFGRKFGTGGGQAADKWQRRFASRGDGLSGWAGIIGRTWERIALCANCIKWKSSSL